MKGQDPVDLRWRVYEALWPNGRRYLGYTSRSIGKRIRRLRKEGSPKVKLEFQTGYPRVTILGRYKSREEAAEARDVLIRDRRNTYSPDKILNQDHTNEVRWKVYELRWPNGCRYVGSTGQPIGRRVRQHRVSGTPDVQSAFRKWGPPAVTVLEEHDTRGAAQLAEEAHLTKASRTQQWPMYLNGKTTAL